MGLYMKENIKMVKNKELVISNGLMDHNILVNSMIICKKKLNIIYNIYNKIINF